MIKRTYSRRNAQVQAEESSSKRRRVQTTPLDDIALPNPIATSSSPSPRRDGLLSDEPVLNSTPPSSPPPATKRFLSKARPAPVASQKHKPKPTKRLTQLTLDLGQSTRKKCKQCGMEYTPSNSADNALHKKFHAQNLGGLDLSRRFVEAVSKEDIVWSKGTGGEIIVAIDRSSSGWKRKIVETVGGVVEKELGGVGVEGLWEQIADGDEDRYKAFLYLRGQKCVGYCLVERIQEAFPVLDDAPSSATKQEKSSRDSSSITVSDAARPALMGISRVWTSNSAKRSGIAVSLLDCATQNFLYGMKIPKEEIAFSQPTESGGRLARKWFGRESGWLVYSL